MKILMCFFFQVTFIFIAISAKVDTVYIQSKCMNNSIPNLIITPDNYASQTLDFPVLYLLHGAGNDYTEWLKHVPNLGEYSDKYNYVIACPDAGRTSWYFDSPIDSTMKYETYICNELVSYIDANYKTITNRNNRAIVGLSMGGHGAQSPIMEKNGGN